MHKHCDFYHEVLNVVLTFEGTFTIKKLIETLIIKGVMNDNNKQHVLASVDEVLENGLIRHIQFTQEYYVG